MRKEKAITLLEITITIIIISILAAMAVPMFPRAMEATRAKEAMASLQQIRTGERIYRVEENTYFYSSAVGNQQRIEELNNLLRVQLNTLNKRNWNYKVEDGGVTGSTFDATATRTSGSYINDTIIIDEQGAVDPASSWPANLLPGQ